MHFYAYSTIIHCSENEEVQEKYGILICMHKYLNLNLTFEAIPARAGSPVSLGEDMKALWIAKQQLYLASIPKETMRLVLSSDARGKGQIYIITCRPLHKAICSKRVHESHRTN